MHADKPLMLLIFSWHKYKRRLSSPMSAINSFCSLWCKYFFNTVFSVRKTKRITSNTGSEYDAMWRHEEALGSPLLFTQCKTLSSMPSHDFSCSWTDNRQRSSHLQSSILMFKCEKALLCKMYVCVMGWTTNVEVECRGVWGVSVCVVVKGGLIS